MGDYLYSGSVETGSGGRHLLTPVRPRPTAIFVLCTVPPNRDLTGRSSTGLSELIGTRGTARLCIQQGKHSQNSAEASTPVVRFRLIPVR